MTRTYIVTDETSIIKGIATADETSFTSKKAAKKAIAKRNADGKHYACYIYHGKHRADNGCLDAEMKIKGIG